MLLLVRAVTCLVRFSIFSSVLFSSVVISIVYDRRDDILFFVDNNDGTDFTVWKNSLELISDPGNIIRSNAGRVNANENPGGNESFRLSWKISENGDKLILLAEARTKGYFGVGFSKDGIVDIAIGWINDKGRVFLFDCHEDTETETVLKDTVQNYELLGGYENSTHTIILFSRLWDTCDRHHDVSLTNDTIQLVWIMGVEDPSDETLYGLRWHGKEERGRIYTYLQNSPILSQNHRPNTKQWDVTISNLSIDNRESNSICRVFRIQKLSTKHHIIGYEPVLEKQNKNSIKRIILYECNGKHTFRIEQYMTENGFTCRQATNAPEELESCVTPVFMWASGSEGEFLPEHVGLPMGMEISYYMLEIYYENTGYKQSPGDKSGLRLYYTDKLRRHDGGVFVTGTVVSPLHIIPPFQTAYKTAGYCDKYCTNTVFPTGGVNTISVVLHSHFNARKVKLRHFRQGEELHPIVQDNHYEFKYQQSHSLEREITLFPGDELVTECTYNTINKFKPIQGGYTENDEMCISYVTYYPRVSLAGCQSISPASNFFHTFGIKQFYSYDMDTLESALFGRRDKLLGKKRGTKFSSKEHLYSSSAEDKDEKLNDAIADDRTSTMMSRKFNGDADVIERENNPLENLVILEPNEFRDKTLKQHLQDLPWQETLLTQRVEEVFYFGKHMTFCRLQNGSLALPASTHIFPNVIVYRVPTNENNSKCSSSTDVRNTKRSSSAASVTYLYSTNIFLCLLVVVNIV